MSKRVKIPLLHDHHSHPLFYAAFGLTNSLEAVTEKKKANRLIQQAIDENAAAHSSDMAGQLTVLHGWRSNYFGWSQDELEKLPPISIINLSLHSLLINEAGLNVLVQRYGKIAKKLRDHDWYERNLRTVLNWFATLFASTHSLMTFHDRLWDEGVGFVEEMLLVDEREIELYRDSGLINATKFWAAPETFDQLSNRAKSDVHGLKLFADGAIGACTAALSRPFTNGPENHQNCGMLIYTDGELASKIDRCLETGKSLAVHAIGDRAIEQVISTLESNDLCVERRTEQQIRIEHAQLITLEQAERAKQLGVVLSMQPNFSSDSEVYRDRLDSEFCESNNPIRMLIDQAGFIPGEDLILGSDGMPHGADAALNQSLFPPIDNQRLNLDEFVDAYCEASLDDQQDTCPPARYIEIEISDSSVNVIRTRNNAP